MHTLNTIAITLAALMGGNELAVSAFVNAAIWRLSSGPQAQGLSVRVLLLTVAFLVFVSAGAA